MMRNLHRSLLIVTLCLIVPFFLISCNLQDPEPERLFISQLPDKKVYFEGESLNLSGIKVQLLFSNGVVEEVTNYEIARPHKINEELTLNTDKTIVLKYADKEVSFNISVLPLMVSFSQQPQNMTFPLYQEGNTLKASVSVYGTGTLTFSWYTKTMGKTELVQTDQPLYVEIGKTFSSELKLEKINYMESDYYCIATLTQGSVTMELKSDVAHISQTIDTGIPVLKIRTTDSLPITSKEEYLAASFDLVSDEYEDMQVDNIQIKGRGNSSWGMPKKSFTVKLDSKTEILEMPKSKKWVLIANYADKSLLRNKLSSDLGHEIYTNMEWNPSFKFVELVLNGSYEGTYLIGEQIKIEKQRLNIPSIADTVIGKGEDVNNDGVVDKEDGGFLVEVNARLDETFNFTTSHGIPISLKDPDVEDFEENQELVKTHIIEILQNAENILYSENWLDSENGYRKHIDVTSFIDWYIINEITKNNDACWFSSVYMYYNPEDCKLYMGPDWDFDISCGNIDYNGCDDFKGFWIKNSGWHKRLFEDPIFVSAVKERWNNTKTDLLKTINTDIQEQSVLLSDSADINFKRWNILGSYVWPNAAGFEERTTYQTEINYLIEWLNNRYTWLDSAINSL